MKEADDDEEVSGNDPSSPGAKNNSSDGGLLNASGADAQTKGDDASKSMEEIAAAAAS